MLKIAFTP